MIPLILRYKKPLAIAAGVAVVLLLLVSVIFRTPSVHITTEDGAEILASTSRNEALKTIGKGKGKISIKGASELFVRVRNGDRETLANFEINALPSRDIHIDLQDLLEPTVVTQAGLSHIHTEGEFVYGINPNTQSLTYRALGSKKVADVSYLKLPRLQKVTWQDRHNFIYQQAITGIGLFIDNKPIAFSATNSSTDQFYYDYAASPDLKNIFVVNSQGVYLNTEGLRGKNYQEVYTFDDSQRFNDITSDGKLVYVLSGVFDDNLPARPDGTPTDAVGNRIATRVSIFNFAGQEQQSFEIAHDQAIEKVVQLNDANYGLLSQSSFMIYNTESKQTTPSPLHDTTADLANVAGKTVLLNSSGIWRYDNNYWYMIARAGDEDSLVEGSLGVSGNAITYSSIVGKNEVISDPSPGENTIFQLTLSQ